MKSGFTLIEILIAIALSSIVATMLFSVFFQANRSARVVDSYVDMYTKAALVARQFERDISGACVPWSLFLPDPAQQPTPPPAPIPGKTIPQKPEPEKPAEPEESKKKQLKKIFFSSSEGSNLKILTFITNNPTAQYWSEQIGKPKPRLARVVYSIQKQTDIVANKDSYVLKRQEGTQLEYGAYKKDDNKAARSFDVIDGIKSISIDYAVHIEDKKENTSGVPKKNIKRVSSWDSDAQAESEEQMPMLPGLVTIKLQLWDQAMQKAVPFEFTVRVLGDGLPPAESAVPQAQQAPTQPDAKKGTPPVASPATGIAQITIQTVQLPTVAARG